MRWRECGGGGTADGFPSSFTYRICRREFRLPIPDLASCRAVDKKATHLRR